MTKPVMNPEFWRERLYSSHELRCSVFNTSKENWEEINNHHYKMLTTHIKVNNDKVLEAGCGYGRWAYLFTNYTGVDISPDFIKLAQETYPERKNNFLVGDLRNLPFEDNTFDWCFHISVKGMIVREVGSKTWDIIEKELLRVSKKVLCLEYGGSLLSNNPNRDNIEILTK